MFDYNGYLIRCREHLLSLHYIVYDEKTVTYLKEFSSLARCKRWIDRRVKRSKNNDK